MSGKTFTLAARRLIATNARFDIFFDRIETAGGATVPEFLTVRPKVLVDGISGVCILPEVDGRIGLMCPFRHQFDEQIWQAPAGFSEVGETVEETARRELEEETGLTCAPGKLVSLGVMIPDAGIIEAKVALFVARDAAPLACAQLPDDEPGVGGLHFFTPAELRRLALSSRAMGAATTIACMRYLMAAHDGAEG